MWEYQGIKQFVTEITGYNSGGLLEQGQITWDASQFGTFYNPNTGEIKMFSPKYIDAHGYKSILEKLNEENTAKNN